MESTDLRYCWKCGKMKPKDVMKPKFDTKGRRIGSQCETCINRKSTFMNVRKKEEK